MLIIMKKYKKGTKIKSQNPKGYVYELAESVGRNFHPDFRPELTPKEMLELGVFGGLYFREDKSEYPESWFKKAKIQPDGVEESNKNLNYFGVNASQSLKVWQEKGWIYKDDPRGWFQWYARYYLGRRLTDGEDERQIKRWKNMKRYASQIINNCTKGDLTCRKKQRQVLLHWAYDGRG